MLFQGRQAHRKVSTSLEVMRHSLFSRPIKERLCVAYISKKDETRCLLCMLNTNMACVPYESFSTLTVEDTETGRSWETLR